MPVSDGKTFGLLRTNHKLTGNVKISVDQKNNVYLNSFDANNSLSDSRFKKRIINPDSKLSADLYKFFDNGTLSKNLIYDTYRISDDLTVKTEFWRHYEQQYTYGVSRCDSQLYDEQFCFLAPIWLNKDIPKYFIIFKNSGARNTEYERNPTSLVIGRRYRVVAPNGSYVQYSSQQLFNGDVVVPDDTNGAGYTVVGDAYIVQDDPNYENEIITDPDNFLESVISPSNIVAIFDLSDKTSIGKYIRKHVNDPLYTDKMVNVDYNNNRLEYTGIDIKTGVITTKSEQLDDLIDRELDIIDFDEYVTLGFERNSLLSVNLLNLEFMFDDNLSDDYTFNRYYGFYCDDIDMARFFVDRYAMFNKSSGLYYNSFWDKETLPYYYGKKVDDAGGIKVIPQELFDQEGYVFRKDEVNETQSIFYIKDKRDGIHKINNQATTDNYTLNDTEIDTELLFGFSDKKIELAASALKVGGQSNIIITVNSEVFNGYRIEVYYRNTLLGNVYADNLPDLNTLELELIENDYSGDPSTPYVEGESVGWYFHPSGTNEQIAQALRGAFDYLLLDYNIDAINIGDKVILRSRSFGSGFDQYSIRVIGDNGEMSFDNTNFSGGSDRFISRARIDKDFPVEVTTNSYVATTTGYCKIKSIAAYLDEPIVGSDGVVVDYKGFEQYVVINLVDESQEIKFTNGVITIYNDQKLSMGVLSLYDLKDFDFDFYSSIYTRSYSKYEYQKYFKVGTDQLVVDVRYTVYKQDDDPIPVVIEHNGLNFIEGDTFEAVNNQYSVISGNPIIIADKYYNDLELKRFEGFQTLDINQTINLPLSADPDDLKNKFRLFEVDESKTEYDRLKEIDKSSNILKSKLIPYINKWVLSGGRNIRDVEYRFNVSKVFGEMNFSPSFNDEVQDPNYFTHEWYYLSSIPETINRESLIDTTSYFSRIFNIDRLKDEKKDYFSDYFTLDYHVVKNGNNQYEIVEVPTQRRYTTIKKVSSQNFETFFKGSKVKVFSSSIDYSDYKFSVIMNLKKSEYLRVEKPFEINVYENRDFKNISVVIDVVIDDYKVVPDIDKQVYGEYIYLYVMDSLKRWNDVISSSIASIGLFGQVITVPDDVTALVAVGDYIQITDSVDNNGVYEILNISVGVSGTDITIFGGVPNISDTTGIVRHYGYKFGLVYDYPVITGVGLYNTVGGLPQAFPRSKFRGFQMYNKVDMTNITNPNVMKFDGSYLLLEQQLKVDQNGLFNRLLGISASDVFVQTSENVFYSPTQYLIDKPNTLLGVNDPSLDSVLLENSGLAVVNIPFLLAVGSYDPIDVQNNITDLSKLIWFHEFGGSGVYSDIARILSFANLANIFNEDQYFVNYKLISNGVETPNTDMKIRLFEPSVINRSSSLSTSQINLTFPELPSEVVIDYQTTEISEDLRYLRYGGNFVPKFNDIIKFKNDKMVMAWGLYDEIWSEIDHTWNEYRDGDIFVLWSDANQEWAVEDLPWNDLEIDVNNVNVLNIPISKKLYDLNTRFDTTIQGFGEIENYFFHKVSPSNPSLLALQNPIYPSVGEIAIDKKTFNIFKSDFDPYMLERFVNSKTISESVYGSFSTRDFKSFLGTKLLKIEKLISNSTYQSISQAVGIEDVQFDMGNNDLVYELVGNQIVFRLSLRKKISEYIYENMESEFKRFVNEFNTTDGSFDAAIRTYINENIINLYEIIEVKPYIKKFNQSTNIDLVYNEENELIVLGNGYNVDKNVTTQKVNNLEVIVKYNVGTEFNYSFNLRVKVGS